MNKKETAKPLTKKYLVKIADTFKKYGPIDVRLINELMDIFEDMNPRFNRLIFLNAVIKNINEEGAVIKKEQDISNINDAPNNRPFKGFN